MSTLLDRVKTLIPVFYCLVILCLFLVGYHEFRLYPNYWRIRLGVPAEVFYSMAALALLVIRFGLEKRWVRLPRHLFDAVTAVSLLLLAGGLYFVIKENVLDYNYAFQAHRILSDELIWFAVIFTLLGLLSFPVTYLHARGRLLLFYLPVLLYAVMMNISLSWQVAFERIQAEDGLIEYSTAAFFFLSSACFFWISRRERRLPYQTLVFFAAVALFLLAGEEISWGQRLLGVETPEAIADINTQGELTLHNLKWIYGHIVTAYVVIGVSAGLLIPLLKQGFRRIQHDFIQELTPWLFGFTTSLYFLSTAVQRYFTREFPLLRFKFLPWDTVPWNEFSESVAALGVFIFACGLVLQYRSRLGKRKLDE